MLLLKTIFGMDSFRFGLFLAFFSGGFRAIQCLLRKHRQKEDRWNAFVAGSLSSLAILLEVESRRRTWTVYLLPRALDLVYRYGVMRNVLPVYEYGDVALFSLFSCVVMYAWQLQPDTMANSFHSWIRARGGLDLRQLSAVAQITYGNYPVELTSWCNEHKIPNPAVSNPNMTFLPCSTLHPLYPSSCTIHAILRWFIGFKNSFHVYLPVHLLPLLLFRWRTILKDPVHTLTHTVSAIAMSTSFITSFQAIFWFVLCHSRHLTGYDNRFNTFLAGFASGLSILWEKPSRRPELALFTLARAFDVSWNMLLAAKWGIKPIEHGEVFLFSIVMGLIMMFYQHIPETFKPTYLKLVQRLMGHN